MYPPPRCPLRARRSRKEALEKALAHSAAGNTAAAFECYQRAVDISPEVAKGLIVALQAAGVEYVVAPYEADAQMAYMARRHLVHAVLSEDSDMLTYGCPRVRARKRLCVCAFVRSSGVLKAFRARPPQIA